MDSKLVYFLFASGVFARIQSVQERISKIENNGKEEGNPVESVADITAEGKFFTHKLKDIEGMTVEQQAKNRKMNREKIDTTYKSLIGAKNEFLTDFLKTDQTGTILQDLDLKTITRNGPGMEKRKAWLQDFLVNRPYAPGQYCLNDLDCPVGYCKTDGAKCKKKYSCDSDAEDYCDGESIKEYNKITSLPVTFYENINNDELFKTELIKKALSKEKKIEVQQLLRKRIEEELRYFCRSLFLQEGKAELKLTDENFAEVFEVSEIDEIIGTKIQPGKITHNENQYFCINPYDEENQKRCESHKGGKANCDDMIKEQKVSLCAWDEEAKTCGVADRVHALKCTIMSNRSDKMKKEERLGCERCKSITKENYGKLSNVEALEKAKETCETRRKSAKLCKWENKCITSEESSLTGLNGTGLMLGSGDELTLENYAKLLEKSQETQGPKYGKQDTFMTKNKDTVNHMSIESSVTLKQHFVDHPMLSQSDETS